MSTWKEMLEGNRRWARERAAEDPGYFARIASEHRPKALYIGCSDARVPADVVTDTDLGELFVHRNIANQVLSTDTSLFAGLQYAVEVLGVEEVIVCGHHACGGVRAALSTSAPAHVEAWISQLRMLARLHRDDLHACDEGTAVDRLVDINVREQVLALAHHPIVRSAWAAGRALRLHGWVYDLPNGLLEPRIRIEGPHDVARERGNTPSSLVTAQAK